MEESKTKITPLDPAFHGESNYEIGLEDLLAEKRKLVARLEADPQTTVDTMKTAKEELQVVETLWENYHVGMNVFRNAKGGRDGLRDIKTD